MKHIDDWLDERIYGDCKEEEKYAVAFLFLNNVSAVDNWTIKPIMKDHKLFCIHDNKKYRVIGCSSLGSILLHSDFAQDSGYRYIVDVEECSSWSDK